MTSGTEIPYYWRFTTLAPVVQKVDNAPDNAIHWINLYPVNSTIHFPNIYPLDPVGSAILYLNNRGLIWIVLCHQYGSLWTDLPPPSEKKSPDFFSEGGEGGICKQAAVWNFCAHFSDAISWITCHGITKCWLLSRALSLLELKISDWTTTPLTCLEASWMYPVGCTLNIL